jgi:hypothetical protein
MRLIGRSRWRRKENIKIDLTEIGGEVVDRIRLAQDREQWWAVVNTVMDFREP